MDKQQIASLALSSAHKVLHEKVIVKVKKDTNSNQENFPGAGSGTGAGVGTGTITEQDCIDLNSEINKKWIKLDMKMMKLAFEIETERVLALDRGESFNLPIYDDDLDDLHMYQDQDPGPEIPEKNVLSKSCELSPSSGNNSVKTHTESVVDQSTTSGTSSKQVTLFTFVLSSLSTTHTSDILRCMSDWMQRSFLFLLIHTYTQTHTHTHINTHTHI